MPRHTPNSWMGAQPDSASTEMDQTLYRPRRQDGANIRLCQTEDFLWLPRSTPMEWKDHPRCQNCLEENTPKRGDHWDIKKNYDHPLKGPPEWSPTSINLKIKPTGPNLVQGTSINLLGLNGFHQCLRCSDHFFRLYHYSWVGSQPFCEVGLGCMC